MLNISHYKNKLQTPTAQIQKTETTKQIIKEDEGPICEQENHLYPQT